MPRTTKLLFQVNCGVIFLVVSLYCFGPTSSLAAAKHSGMAPSVQHSDGKLRILCFGAHPDDCEIKIGGTGALWASQGHQVKFVSITNGDIGHWRMSGKALAERRSGETRRADQVLGVTTEILDIHDGELEPTLANRKIITKIIRQWKADLVFSHRPNDYHPDHRYTGVLVQDAAYMVTVPFFCPEAPNLTKNPVFMYYADRFERPNPSRADVVVAIDAVIEKKLRALEIMESQFLEGGANGHAGLIPAEAGGLERRKRQVREGFQNRDAATAKRFAERFSALYGPDADKYRYAEAFELCEYGSQPSKEEWKRLFPMVPYPVAAK
jgi:LmbE family N-acetylglucosaminyl deacetylase